MRTIITHFYNEEYLLPWWLNHHKKYFDFGVLIDYGSTDDSVNIIKELCPHWQIFPSRYEYFDARSCDTEVMFYERQLSGWRIALTVTEFLVGNVDALMHIEERRTQWLIPGIRFTSWRPAESYDKNKELWAQQNTGVSYKTNPWAHQCRSLHNFNDIEYTPGRHFLPHNTEEALIFHYANCIVGPEMLNRRLALQHKISPADKAEGLGNHHYIDHNGMTIDGLAIMHRDYICIGESDCTELINTVTKTSP